MVLALDFLKDVARRHGDEIALEVADVPVSYTELVVAVTALAVALQMQDPIRGSRVGLCAAPNSPEYVVSMMAIVAAGKVILPMNCHGNADEMFDLLTETHPTAVIVDDLGDSLINSDGDLKIHFSQFPGLVHTYRDHSVDNSGVAPMGAIE